MVKHKDRQGLPESQAKMYHDINWFRLSDESMWESCLIYSKNRPHRKQEGILLISQPPLMLLGTEEANRIANEEGKRIREYMDGFYGKITGEKERDGL